MLHFLGLSLILSNNWHAHIIVPCHIICSQYTVLSTYCNRVEQLKKPICVKKCKHSEKTDIHFERHLGLVQTKVSLGSCD